MRDEEQTRMEALTARLFGAREPEDFLRENEEALGLPSFSSYLKEACMRLGDVPKRVALRANLEKSFGHQLFSGRRNPSRDTVLQLAFALGFGAEQAQEMLRVARKCALCPRVPRDAVILHALHAGRALTDVQIGLERLGLPILGGRDR